MEIKGRAFSQNYEAPKIFNLIFLTFLDNDHPLVFVSNMSQQIYFLSEIFRTFRADKWSNFFVNCPNVSFEVSFRPKFLRTKVAVEHIFDHFFRIERNW
jgi:hypothetical protein